MSESATCQLCGTSLPLVHDGTALQCDGCICACHDGPGWGKASPCTSCHRGLLPAASHLSNITCRECLHGAILAANVLLGRVRAACAGLEAASRDCTASRAARDELFRCWDVPATPVVLCARCRRGGLPMSSRDPQRKARAL